MNMEKGKKKDQYQRMDTSSSKGSKIKDVKKIRVVKEFPKHKSGLIPLNFRLVKSEPELALYASKKNYSKAVNKASSNSQVGTPETSHEVMDCQSEPSTSGICNQKDREFFSTRTWLSGDTKHMEFVGKGAADIPIPPEPKPKPEKVSALGVPLDSLESWGEKYLLGGAPIKFRDDKKNPNKIYEVIEMTEVPENIFESSDEETSDQGYLRIRDVYYNSPLTAKEKAEEARLSQVYIHGGENFWGFSGKGSSSFP